MQDHQPGGNCDEQRSEADRNCRNMTTTAAYYGNPPRPPSCTYSEGAEILYKNVTGNIHVVEKALPGQLPSTQTVKDANEKPPSSATRHQRQLGDGLLSN